MSSVLLILPVLICGVLPTVIMAGIGIYLIINWQRNQSIVGKSLAWSLTTGKVIDRNIHIVNDFSVHDEYEYAPVVSYTYEVEDQSYQSNVFSFGKGPKYVVYEEAMGKLEKYQLGDEVSVYYNPEDPSEAVLEREAHGSKMRLVMGILFLVPTACMICFFAWLLVDQILRSL